MNLPPPLIRLFKLIINEIRCIFLHFIVFYPSSPIGNKIRGMYYRHLLKTTDKPIIMHGSRLVHPKLIQIGNKFVAGENVVMNASNSDGIFIGNEVGIAHHSYIRSGNHLIDNVDVPIRGQGHTCKRIDYKGKTYSVVIEDNVWIAASCIILSGAHIGEGSVISAGSVVSHKIPPYSIVVGNPGRVVSNRKKLGSIK